MLFGKRINYYPDCDGINTLWYTDYIFIYEFLGKKYHIAERLINKREWIK